MVPFFVGCNDEVCRFHRLQCSHRNRSWFAACSSRLYISPIASSSSSSPSPTIKELVVLVPPLQVGSPEEGREGADAALIWKNSPLNALLSILLSDHGALSSRECADGYNYHHGVKKRRDLRGRLEAEPD